MNDNLPVIARNIRVRRSVPEAAAIPQMANPFPPTLFALACALAFSIPFCGLIFGVPS